MKDRYWFGVVYLTVFGIITIYFLLVAAQPIDFSYLLPSAAGFAFIPSLIINLVLHSFLVVRRKHLQSKTDKNT